MLQLPFLSFFSKKLYRDVGQNWKGANIAYLFILLAICWVPVTLQLRREVVQSLGSNQSLLLNQIPDIHIKNGRVEMNQKKPYPIKNLSGKTVAIIDTTGSMNYIADNNVKVLLTEDKIIFRRGQNQFKTLSLAQIGELHLNKEVVAEWLQTTQGALTPLSYGLLLLLSCIFTVFVVLMAAVTGWILSPALHSALKFAGVMRVAAAAATPAIILITVAATLGQSIPGPIYIAVALSYLFIALKSCAGQAEDQETPRLNLVLLLHKEDSVHIHDAA